MTSWICTLLGTGSQERHDLLGKERQSEFERASAADVARAAQEVQLTTEQQHVAQLTAQLQEAAVQTQAIPCLLLHINCIKGLLRFCSSCTV